MAANGLASPANAATAEAFQQAAVPAANTGDSDWAGALVSDEGGVFADFVEYLRPRTILGRFGTDGVPSLRRVPFRVPLVGQTTGGEGYWVGEGKAKTKPKRASLPKGVTLEDVTLEMALKLLALPRVVGLLE